MSRCFGATPTPLRHHPLEASRASSYRHKLSCCWRRRRKTLLPSLLLASPRVRSTTLLSVQLSRAKSRPCPPPSSSNRITQLSATAAGGAAIYLGKGFIFRVYTNPRSCPPNRPYFAPSLREIWDRPSIYRAALPFPDDDPYQFLPSLQNLNTLPPTKDAIVASSKKSFDHTIVSYPIEQKRTIESDYLEPRMSDRSTAALLQLYQSQQQRQNGNRNMFLDSQLTNGNAVQFASNTGNGGTWQKNGAASSSNGVINGYSLMGGFANGTSGLIPFKCSECSLTKNSCDELEIHIKTEHLNWLPFRCLKCGANRASDTQIREHMFSAHKNDKTVNQSNFGYVDNQAAKRELQSMLDRALTEAATAIAKRSGAVAAKAIPNATASVSAPHVNNQPQIKRPRLVDPEPVPSPPARAVPTVTVLPRSTTDDILAQITGGLPAASDPAAEGLSSITEGGEDVDDFTANQLSAFFGNGSVNESAFEDYNESYVSGGAGVVDNDSSLLENITALFGNGDLSTNKVEPSPSGKVFKTRAPRGSRPVTCISKKRVLGECSRCQKPVTAGARQMHMFYHLGKDYNTYRFKCKFDECDVEHYRKDQMENHQSKMHGGIDAAMMEDRSAELADMVQQLSLELLGTVGNTPGPTAERAQVLYDQQQREAAEAQTKKKRRGGPASVPSPPAPSSPSTSTNTNSPPPPKFGGKLDPGFVKPENQKNEEFIKCNVCHKTHQKRVRGFHLLWHLSNDYGIVRYVCKQCDYKHERPQSVATHGRREHNDGNCCEDSLWRYKDQVSEISMKCYGVDQSFSKDVFKQPKVEDLLLLNENEEDGELDENQLNGSGVEDEEEAPPSKIKAESRASYKPEASESQVF
uniref:C2H2-type domain-containing protein n=1 Tax=Panagrellus redivivus TaxID=6233 RepID=A0A7E4V0E9_PANRE